MGEMPSSSWSTGWPLRVAACATCLMLVGLSMPDASQYITPRDDLPIVIASICVGGQGDVHNSTTDMYMNVTMSNHLNYARRHGYQYIVSRSPLDDVDSSINVRFHKVVLMLRLFKAGYPW